MGSVDCIIQRYNVVKLFKKSTEGQIKQVVVTADPDGFAVLSLFLDMIAMFESE